MIAEHVAINNESSSIEFYKKATISEKVFATFFSYAFHPLFIPLYVITFLTFIHPSAFSGFSEHEKKQTILIIALNIVFFPLLSVLLLRAVGFINSIYLHTKKDRIIPYMACGIFFFWAYTVFKNQPAYPLLLTSFIFGIFLASSAGLIANIYFKISMHATGMGGWLGFFLVIFYQETMQMSWPIMIVIILSGLVCSARLLISDHSQKEIYTGYVAGLLTQITSAAIILN